MSTRLGFSNTYDTARNNLQVRQTNLSNLQENLTSGKKVVRSSDDPTGAAQAERALTRLSRIQTDQRALESQRNSIAMAESTLGDVTAALQTFRELTVSAGNATHSAEEQKTIAIQLTGLRDQIFALANRKDTNGLPLFGALGSALAPFVGPTTPPTDYRFDGLPGQSASSEVSIPFTLDGDSAFMHQPARDGAFNAIVSTIPTTRTLTTDNLRVSNSAVVSANAIQASIATGIPNSFPGYVVQFTAVDSTSVPGTTTATYSVTETPPVSVPAVATPVTISYPSNSAAPIAGIPGLSFSINGTPAIGDTVTVKTSPSIFSVLDDAIRDIGGAANRNAATQAVTQALNNIDIGMSRISAVRGQAGDLLNRADRITSNQEVRSIQLEADRSRAEDLNMIKGVSDFQNQNTGYQAALQSYAQIQKLSLFNYIG
jgi:flagellar hook-associated protein 3 FlgL